MNFLRDTAMYLKLWIGVRFPKWDVRVGALIEMAKLFNAFDRTHYTELCAPHFADLWQFPE